MSHGIVMLEDAVAIYKHQAWHLLADVIEGDQPPNREVIAARAKLPGWGLARQHIYDQAGRPIEGFMATVRTDVGRVLGVHGERFEPFENEKLMDFCEAIRGNATYNSAGCLFGGKLIFVCMDAGDYTVLDRKVHQYILVSNRHDGEAALRTCLTPVEAVCANTVAAGFSQATRSWSTRHTKSLRDRAREASYTLKLHNAYFEEYKAQAEQLAAQKLNMVQIDCIIESLFPEKPELQSQTTVMRNREALRHALRAPDLENFRFSGWGIVQAAADYESHYTPKGAKRGFEQRRFLNLIDGSSTLVDRTLSLVEAIA